MASRNTTLKLKQNNTGKVLSININQEIVEKPNVPSGVGLHWKHPFSGQWISNTRRVKSPNTFVDISNAYNTQGTLTINTLYIPRADCDDFNIRYIWFGTDVNDSGELIKDSKIKSVQEKIDQYFRDLISIPYPLYKGDAGKITLDFRKTLGRDPISMIPPEANITVFYIAIKGGCGYYNIIPLDFTKIKNK